MKKITALLTVTLLLGMLAGCKAGQPEGTRIELSDNGITVDGKAVTADETQAVYTANDIIYYEAGHDFTYGEGTETDAHSKEEAAAHTVVHITQAGQYVLSGTLSKGQVAVDLGEDAEEDPSAVVTLILDGVNITCDVAPAVIFYNVYECADKDAASATVDTSAAGANVIIADGTENTVNGAYVARIYKPDSVELSQDGTEVVDSKKLHKYDGAFYSKMSMNVDGDTGVLNIIAANEGLDSELHLTINGGNIRINAGNDGINTNEDGVSVTTVNGGSLDILVNGSTGEGDGIDSNGWLVINGGSVTAQACGFSGDAGIDSDMGIHINGGTVFATGNMLDRISQSQQTYAVFQFAGSQKAGVYTLKDKKGNVVAEQEVSNDFMNMVVSGKSLTKGTYTLWRGDVQLQGMQTGNMGGFGGGIPNADMEMPEGMTPPEGFDPGENMTPPEGFDPGENMTPPEGFDPGENMTPPEGANPGEGMAPPEGMEKPDDIPARNDAAEDRRNPDNRFVGGQIGEVSDNFELVKGENYFIVMNPAE